MKVTAFKKILNLSFIILAIAYSVGANGSPHNYYCNCNIPKGGDDSCFCTQSTITGASNPLNIGKWATPELDATCKGKSSNGSTLTVAINYSGIILKPSSTSITCTIINPVFCLGGGQACRDCTNWSVTSDHSVTVTGITCVPRSS